MDLSKEALKRPDNRYAVTYTWGWNATITREGIDRELERMKLAGIRSIYIIPLPISFRPETNRTFLFPDYLTEEFFDLVKYAINRAKEMGIGAWLYDEGGWPSGGACTHTLLDDPDAAVRILKTREVTLMRAETYQPGEGAIAVFDGRQRLPDSFTAYKDMTVTEYYAERFTEHPNLVDLTRAETTDTFINNTYEKYKDAVGDLFGDYISIMFTDEPAAKADSFPLGYAEAFIKEYGYDIRDRLYVITEGEAGCRSASDVRARIDHGMLLGKLVRRNTFNKLRDWCRENRIRFGGHLNNDNLAYGGMQCGCSALVDCLRGFDVPGIDVIWEQIRYPYEGRSPLDDETRGMGFFPRIAASAARQERRRQTLSETFGIYGSGLTPDEMRYVVNYQLIRGINTFNFGGLSYSEARALAYTHPFSPSKPGYYNLGELNEYVTRLSYLANLGDPEGDTALFHPIRDYWADAATVIRATESFNRLGTELEERNVAFDIIDEYGVLDAEVTDEGLRLGDALYRHVVIPETGYTPECVLERLKPFIGEGKPTYTPKNEKLRFMTRKLENGRLWFIFNEGIDPITERLDISEGKRIYEIDPRAGEIFDVDEATVDLPCGEVAVFLITDETVEAKKKPAIVCSTEVTGLHVDGYDRFTLEVTGLKLTHYEGEPVVDGDFSGTLYYKASYSLSEEPKAGERYRIRLDDSAVTAKVLINGESVCSLAMTPMAETVDGAKLPKSGEISILLSNTAANEMVAKREWAQSYFPKAEIGPYYFDEFADKLPEFEKRRPAMKLGRLFIEKLDQLN